MLRGIKEQFKTDHRESHHIPIRSSCAVTKGVDYPVQSEVEITSLGQLQEFAL